MFHDWEGCKYLAKTIDEGLGDSHGPVPLVLRGPGQGREDVFLQYDESRRISEDIQQFHNANPEADLSDHYYWEDVLDAESNEYLEDDTEDA